MSQISTCAVCGLPASKTCSACKSTFYCSSEHQKKDWKVHRSSSCRLFLVKRNEVMGRYIVASRDIPKGTLLMDDPALMIGPKQETVPLCLGCYKRVDGGSPLCTKCGIPLCSKACEGAPLHSDYECKILARKKPMKISDFSDHHPFYECILTLRCLLLREKDPPKWERLNTMEAHNGLRQELASLWHRNEINTVNFLRGVYGMEEYDSMTIHTVLGYSDINSFEIVAPGIEICGLFPEVSLMAHDCISNTHHTVTEDYRMIIRTSVDVKKGDLLTTTYTHTLDGTLERRGHIMDSKLFDCVCTRCSSPTECGTHLSTLRCPACRDGDLTSSNSLDPLASWVCSKCCGSQPVEFAKQTVSSIREEMDTIEKNGSQNPIPKLEVLVDKYRDTLLHPNHFLLISAEHSLSQFYGRTKGYTMEELSLAQLQRKESACRRLLQVLDILEPGMSRIRGVTLYELQAAVYFLTQKRFGEEGVKVSKEELKTTLESVLDMLQESMGILSFDSPTSSTGRIAPTIPESMRSIREILGSLCSKA